VLREHVASIADRLAAHLLEADQRDRAGRLLVISAQRKCRSGQLEAAVQEFLRAMNLLEFATATGEELLQWLADMRSVVHRVRVAPRLDEILCNVLERVDASDNIRQRVLARVHGAAMLASTHVFDMAAALADQALALAGGDEALRAKALLAAGAAHGTRGEFRLAVDAYSKIDPATELDPDDAYRLHIGMAQSLGASGESAMALIHLDQAARAADARDLGAGVEREKLRALIFHFSRDFHAAAVASQQGAELARAAGLSYEAALGLHNMGDSLLWLGQFARAHAAFQQSVAVCEHFGYGRLLNHNRMYLTYLDGGQGDTQALDTLRELIREADNMGLTWDALDGRYLLGALALRQGDWPLARQELERVRILARECKSHLLEQSARELLEGMTEETA
jgi:tetratricopeptide (TPR) repeat protein